MTITELIKFCYGKTAGIDILENHHHKILTTYIIFPSVYNFDIFNYYIVLYLPRLNIPGLHC